MSRQHDHAAGTRSSYSPATAAVAASLRAQAALDLPQLQARDAFGRHAEHLEADQRVSAPDLDRIRSVSQRDVGGSATHRAVGLEDGQPAVFRAGLEVGGQPGGAAEPALRDGGLASEVGVVVGEPQRHPGRGAIVTGVAVREVGALSGVDAALDVLEPPGCPAQPLEGFGVIALVCRRLEVCLRLCPGSLRERVPTGDRSPGGRWTTIHGMDRR
jgi:hypothetical protein